MVKRKEMIKSGVQLQEKANRTASKDFVVEASKKKRIIREEQSSIKSGLMHFTAQNSVSDSSILKPKTDN